MCPKLYNRSKGHVILTNREDAVGERRMLPIFTQAIDLLTGSGALVYHLIVLFALEAIIGMTIGHARRYGWSRVLRRALIAAIVLLIGRAIMMIVALLGQIGVPPNIIVSSAITPPLERYIDLVSLGFLAWAFVPLLLDRAQLGLGFVLGNLVLGTIVYAYFGLQWYNTSITPNLFYNTVSQETVWQAWSVALAILATLGAFVGREESSGITVPAFALLSIGHLLQLISPVSTSHIAGWVWLAQLAAYPLFAIAIYRRVAFGETRDESSPAPIVIDQSSNVAPVLEAAQRVASRKDPQLSLIQATAALANAMNADLAAIGLPSLRSGSVELAAIYSPGSAPATNPAFALDKQPSIKRAITRRRPVSIVPGEDQPELAELFTLVGSHVTGPLLIVPLVDDRLVLGVALFGNPTSSRAWTAADAQRARPLCDYLATALTTAKHHESLERRIEEMGHTLRQQEADGAQRRKWLEDALQKVQTEAQQASSQSQQQQKHINELAALVEMHEEQAKQIGSDHSQWQERTDQLTGERARLESELQEHAQETDRLTQLQSGLEKELKEAQQQIVRLQDDLSLRPVLAAEPSSILPEEDHQRELVASLVQELRTPMTSINGYTDLLLGESVGILGAMQRQFLQRVKANIERMDAMLQDLIGITAIETGQIKIEPESIEVSEVIEESVMNAAAVFRDRELSIRIELAEGLPKLKADRDSLHQIISHLLSNAALCSPNGSEVIVRAQVQPEMSDYLLFSVADHGGGIATEDRQRAFHRMYRAENPLIQGLGETGIGLSIAKALVEAQGGRIWVDSVMGDGSTFTFVLPIHPRTEQVESPIL